MINKLFTIEWVGPFQDIESLIYWEKEHNTKSNYYFYIITGKPAYKQIAQNYCGITQNKDGYVHKRFLNDSNHIIHLLRDKEIWIGKFSDNKSHIRNDIELCETMLISYWQPELNIRKKSYYPDEYAAIINRWFKTNLEPREKCLYTAQTMPDLIIYDGHSIWGTERIKKLKDII